MEEKASTEKPVCPKCDKRHHGECLLGKGMCFRCKKPGHFAGKCPEFKGKEDARKGKARVFALTQKEAEKDPDVITGETIITNLNKKGKSWGKMEEKASTEKPVCPKCDKRHHGECLLGKGMCFRCKKPGHFAGECPEFKGKEDARKGKARVFALTQKEAEKDPDVMTG